MRISQAALDKSEPLFTQFIDCMWAIRRYQAQAFQERYASRDLHSETLRVLTNYGLDRSQAAYCLIVNGLVWDAEIIIRTLYEVFAKTVLLATANENVRDKLLEEYWEVLPAMYDRRGALKAEAAESLAKRFGIDGESRIFALLRDRRLYQVDPIGNRRVRKEVDQRWSFSGIVDALRKGRLASVPLDGVDALAHIYGVSSHLAHASPKAFDLMEDRVTRGDDLLHLEIGHICRMLSDIVSLSSFSIHLSERSWTGSKKMPEALATAFQAMSACTKPFQSEFDQSQDDFYRQWVG